MNDFFENNNIPIHELPSVDAVEWTGLEKAYKPFMHIRNAIFYLILSSGLAGVYFLKSDEENLSWILWILGLIALFWIASIVLVIVGFPRKGYALRQHDILYKTGYINMRMTTVPMNRIQHVELRQGLLYRIFGLSRLMIFTAGGNSSDLSIPGLKPGTAEELKAYISEQISKHE